MLRVIIAIVSVHLYIVEQLMVAPIKAANRSKSATAVKPAPAAKAAAPSDKKPELQLKKRPASSAIADDGDFPRGGASVLTPLERREVERQAKDEFDAEVLAGKAPRTAKKQKQDKVCRGGSMPCHAIVHGEKNESAPGAVCAVAQYWVRCGAGWSRLQAR